MNFKDIWTDMKKMIKPVASVARLWILRPLVTVVAAFAITSVTAIYAGWITAHDVWNSEGWEDFE